MVHGKSSKGLPPLRRNKLSKKSKENQDEIKKVYKANKWWNEWRFQLNWNNLEYVNTKSINKRDNFHSVSSKSFT